MTEEFDEWMRALEARHLADLRFSEVSRGLRALSAAYVERRGRLREGTALSGAGKRAAFALFYAPIHYLLVRTIVEKLGASYGSSKTLVDLGCGTGAAGAAWGSAAPGSRPRVLGIDRHPWTLVEAAATYRAFGLREPNPARRRRCQRLAQRLRRVRGGLHPERARRRRTRGRHLTSA